MREPQRRRDARRVEALHLGVHPPQPGQHPLVTALRQQLHADADPEDRRALPDDVLVERRAHPRIFDSIRCLDYV